MRFFCDPLPAPASRLRLSDEIYRHAKVLRIRVGDELELFAEGAACRARVERIDDCLEVWVLQSVVDQDANPSPLNLVQALPKGKKLDLIVRMAVEVGVDSIQLVTSARTVPTWPASRAQEKLKRLEKVAQEAARQSNQRRVATIHPPVPLAELAKEIPSDATRLFFWEASSSRLPAQLPLRPTWLAIGPEGGFDQSEAHTLRECGWLDAALPTGILRVQTAAPVALALVRDRLQLSGND